MAQIPVPNPEKLPITIQLEEQNEFLDLFSRVNTIQRDHKRRVPKLHPKQPLDRLTKQRERTKDVSLLKRNRSVEQILREMRAKEESRKEKISQYNRRIQEEKVYEKKAKEFELAEKKIKNRLKAQQKRLERHAKALMFREIEINQVQKGEENSRTEQFKKEKQGDKSGSLYSDTNIYKAASLHIHPSQSPNISQNHSLSTSKKLKAQLPSNCSSGKQNSCILSLKKKHTKMVTLPTDLDVSRSSVRKVELRQLPKRNGKSMEEELECLYEKESKQCFGKAAELVEKIQNKHRLRLKNINEKDYKQARDKLKLLSFFYRTSEGSIL